MKKLKMKSSDNHQKNIEQIEALFPNVITETRDENGVLKKCVDFGKLKQELLDDVIEGEECYDFTWVGKKASLVEANTPIEKTLRPCIDESKNWETTQNLYIEGDNLDALKLLQESYLGSVKMIYIDPPYNTGKDFIYRDNFTQSREDYEEEAGTFDEEGNRLFVNSETRGRYHSDWCSMIYPRLKLAHKLLKEDGVIFISIDDHEVHNLRKICDEVFGEGNFITNVIWQKIHSTKNDAKYFSDNHDYLIVYAKSIDHLKINLLPRTDTMNSRYKNIDNDPRGPWQSGDLVASEERSNGYYDVISPKTGKKFTVEKGKHWVYAEENMNRLIADNQIWFGNDGNSFPRKKRFLSDVQNGRTPSTIWFSEEVGHSQTATREVKNIFDDKRYFDFPKPVELIKQIIQIASLQNEVILDFFSGSATTAHAVMQLNAEDASTGSAQVGNRKFIMIQLPEPCDEKSEAFKAGYKTIADIGKERIRRAGEKIKSELIAKTEGKLDFADGTAVDPEALDIGFRVLKVDSTNMKDVYYAADEYSQESLGMFESNIKDDRTPLDLLYQCLLDWGLPLSLPHTIEKIGKATLHTVDSNALIACFDDNVPESVIREIAERQPLRAVFRDSSFSSSPEKINVSEIFKTLAPGTSVKVI